MPYATDSSKPEVDNVSLALRPSVGSAPEGGFRLLLADDHRIFREGLGMLLRQKGFDVVAEAANGEDAVHLAAALHPSVALLDFDMPILNGLEAAHRIRKLSPDTRTILVATQEDGVSTAEALHAGMHGYIYKTQTSDELIDTVTEVAKGAVRFNSDISEMSLRAYAIGRHPGSSPLSPREREVLVLIAEGRTTRDIAAHLGLSAKTVDAHRSRMMHKLKLHRSAELTRYAVRQHLVKP